MTPAAWAIHRDDLSGRRPAWLSAVLVIGLSSAAISLPAVFKAIHYDDTFYIRVAEHIRQDPWRPFSFEINWFDRPEPAFRVSDSPPLGMYWLALGMSLLGPSEWLWRLWGVPFVVLAVASMYRLARRFGVPGVWATLLAAMNPAMLPSQNLMLDLPALGLALLALWLFVEGVERGDPRRAAGGATAAGLALLVKYAAGTVVPLLGLYAVLRGRPRWVLWLTIPAGLLAVWGLWSWLAYGQVHFLTKELQPHRYDRLDERLLAVLSVWGACVWAGVAVWIEHMRRSQWPAMAAMLLAGLGTAVLVGGLRGAFAGAGLALVVGIAASRPAPSAAPFQDRFTSAFLWAWVGLVTAFGLIASPLQGVRYHLLTIPALVILALRAVRWADGRRRAWTRVGLGAAVVLSVGTGGLAAAADWEWADVYRTWADRLAATYRPAQATLWTLGHWGWQYYAEKAGMRSYGGNALEPQVGDVIIRPTEVHQQRLDPTLHRRLRLIDRVDVTRRVPLALMERRLGFYALVRRSVPYRFSSWRLERFMIYEVAG